MIDHVEGHEGESSVALVPHSPFDAEVAIVGGGPVGLLLAILLGLKGHRVIVLERWPLPYAQPRGVTYDHEIARILSILGIDSDSDPAVQFHDELYYLKNANGENLLIVDWLSISASGWRVRYWFNQPELEERLRIIANGVENVEVRRGWLATSLAQGPDGVSVSGTRTMESGSTAADVVRARYVVGADGANSFVRQALGVEFAGHGFFFDWLILDVIPREKYEMNPNQWQLCDPARPTTIVPGGPRRRRWEYMVLPGESSEELSRPESAWALLKPWGLTPQNAELERSAVYQFQARWAEKWRRGRVLIAGDAAHQMPPFAGEGLCAGIRDAVALSWRLDLVLSEKADDGLLTSYEDERKSHARHYIEFSMNLGKIICVTDPVEAAQRDRRMIDDLVLSKGVPVPTDVAQLGPGIWCEGCAGAGELSVQGIVEFNGRRGRFDEIVGRGWILLGMCKAPADALTAEQRAIFEKLDGRFVGLQAAESGADVVDVEGTYKNWLAKINANFVVIRPDFYIAATASTPVQLQEYLNIIFDRLHLIDDPAFE